MAMHYHQIVILIASCLIAFGVYGLVKMNKNEFPDYTIRQGLVIAVYPGASAEDIEEQVTKLLENYIFTYKEVKKEKTKSVSKDGMVIIQVELNDDFNDKDAFWSKFKLGVQQFKSQLPMGVAGIMVQDDFGDTSALLITMESQDKTYRELNDYMKDLQDSLRTIESVGRMTVAGMQKEQISVYFDSKKLSQYGITDKSIALNLFTKGFVTTAGRQDNDNYESPIYVSRALNQVSDVENMIIYNAPNGDNVRVKDVATVKREYQKGQPFITNNGKRCLVLSVEMKRGRSITDMGNQIYNKLDAFQSTLPQSVSMYRITDQAKVVSDSVVNFLRELLIAVFAVVIVVLLLMPMRVALTAASTIPISIAISLGLFYAFGIELNTVTLAALIVTLGMIVDNSIVIIDSYVDLLGEGKSRWEASIESASHFFRSILSATLAISVTFFPFLLTLKGVMRDFVLSFPWSISIVLFVSLLVAMLLVPFLQFVFIREPMKVKYKKDGSKAFNFLDFIQKFYDKLISWCFKHYRLTVTMGIVSVVLGVVIMKYLPVRLMPAADRDQFAVEIYMPSGSSLEKTTALADKVEQRLRKDSRILSVASFKGMSSPRFHTAYAPQIPGDNYAQFVVNTKDAKSTEACVKDYREAFANDYPQAYVRVKQLFYNQNDNAVEVRIVGDDWNKMKQTADSVMQIMRGMDNLLLVRCDLREPLLSTTVTVDPDHAARLGVSNIGIEQTLAMRYNRDGLMLGTVWNGDYDQAIKVKGDRADSASINDVADELIPVYGGLKNVPLRQVATVKRVWHEGQLPHHGGLRTLTVMSDIKDDANAVWECNKVEKEVNKLDLPTGVHLEMGGEVGENASNMPTLIGALCVAVAIIFFILLFHFKNIATATLLLLSLTLCLFGTVIGVWISGVDFSLTCFLGIISLMGILVRNAIIMYDYAEELRARGHVTAHEAIYESAKRRMRPIFLTSAAASMGVIPMILGRSGLWMPMGAVICYGTIITMFFILTVLPVSYWLVMSGSTRRRMHNDQMEEQ